MGEKEWGEGFERERGRRVRGRVRRRVRDRGQKTNKNERKTFQKLTKLCYAMTLCYAPVQVN